MSWPLLASEPDDLPDGAGQFVQGPLAVRVGGADSAGHAMPQVIADQADGDFLERAGVTELTCVTTSGHQVSLSIIFCSPRTWPSILRNRAK